MASHTKKQYTNPWSQSLAVQTRCRSLSEPPCYSSLPIHASTTDLLLRSFLYLLLWPPMQSQLQLNSESFFTSKQQSKNPSASSPQAQDKCPNLPRQTVKISTLSSSQEARISAPIRGLFFVAQTIM